MRPDDQSRILAPSSNTIGFDLGPITLSFLFKMTSSSLQFPRKFYRQTNRATERGTRNSRRSGGPLDPSPSFPSSLLFFPWISFLPRFFSDTHATCLAQDSKEKSPSSPVSHGLLPFPTMCFVNSSISHYHSRRRLRFRCSHCPSIR